MENFEYIAKNARAIRAKIREAALASGRDPAEITLLAAVKYADVDEINYLHKECGINVIGEIVCNSCWKDMIGWIVKTSAFILSEPCRSIK